MSNAHELHVLLRATDVITSTRGVDDGRESFVMQFSRGATRRFVFVPLDPRKRITEKYSAKRWKILCSRRRRYVNIGEREREKERGAGREGGWEREGRGRETHTYVALYIAGEHKIGLPRRSSGSHKNQRYTSPLFKVGVSRV